MTTPVLPRQLRTGSKLALHLQAHPHYTTAARWIKIMDPPAENRWQDKQIVGRVYMPDGDSNALVAQGAAGADAWFRFCEPSFARAPYIRIWEAPNEPQPVADLAFCRQLRAFTVRLAELMHGAGLQIVGGCLAEGNPGGDDAQRRACFQEIARGLAVCDYWSQHCYWVLDYPHAEAGMNEWHAFRYRVNLSYAAEIGLDLPPLLITECGVDGGIVGRPKRGWRTFCQSKAHYMEQLAAFDAELANDPHVLAATVFTAGPMGWDDFEVDEELNGMINAHIAANGGAYTGAALGGLLAAEFGDDYEDLTSALARHSTLRYDTRPLTNIDRVVLHHTAVAKSTTWQAVAQYHVSSNGWPGIGYHIGVRQNAGRVKVSLLNQPETRSYHAGTVGNNQGLAVVLAGDFRSASPTVEEVDVLRRCVAVARQLWPAIPVVGHGEVPGNQTDCPGTGLSAAIPWLTTVTPGLPDEVARAAWTVAKSGQLIAPNPDSAIDREMAQQGYAPIGNECDVLVGGVWQGVAQLGYAPGYSANGVAFFATNKTANGQWQVFMVEQLEDV